MPRELATLRVVEAGHQHNVTTMNLERQVEKNRKKFTTLVTLLQILDGHIAAIEAGNDMFSGLTRSQIGRGYSRTSQQYRRNSQFAPSYVQRHLGPSGLYEEVDGRFSIQRSLLRNLNKDDLLRISRKVHDLLSESVGLLDGIVTQIREAIDSNDLDRQKRFVIELLASKIGNQGRNFEIMSFAILSVYFRCLGFTLNRFSTTFANDGGMDFVSSNGIYMVTASPTEAKLKSDLAKLPDTERVLVVPSVRSLSDQNGVVSEMIDRDDLVDHFLEWLYQRDRTRQTSRHLHEVLKTANKQYRREYTKE